MIWMSKNDHKFCIKFDDVIPTIVQIMEWTYDPALDFDHDDACLLIRQIRECLEES